MRHQIEINVLCESEREMEENEMTLVMLKVSFAIFLVQRNKTKTVYRTCNLNIIHKFRCNAYH